MNRQAFEAEARKHGFILDRLDKSGAYVQLITEQAWTVWKTSTAAALERAAEVCDGYFSDLGSTWDKQQDAAYSCAKAIRALKDEK
jgi:hypothetical protein